MRQLTNKVLLSSAHLQRDETDHADERRRETEHEGEVDGRLVLLALDIREKEERECVNCWASKGQWHSLQIVGSGPSLTKNIRRLIHRKVEVERLGRVKHAASALFLRPLDGNRHAAEERVHPEHDEVDEEDVACHCVDCFAQSRAVRREDAPVEGEHAHFGEAHADVVEVVGCEADFGEGDGGLVIVHYAEIEGHGAG